MVNGQTKDGEALLQWSGIHMSSVSQPHLD